jgi:hypothetical protein
MLNIEMTGDPDTKQVHRLTITYITAEDSTKDDLLFITKLANALARGACIIIDPGLATEFVYEFGGIVEEEESEGEDEF